MNIDEIVDDIFEQIKEPKDIKNKTFFYENINGKETFKIIDNITIQEEYLKYKDDMLLHRIRHILL